MPFGVLSGNRGLPSRPTRILNKNSHRGPRLDHILTFRTRAIELAQQAKWEDDPGQRRYLLDLARNFVNVADELAPLPPCRAANFLQHQIKRTPFEKSFLIPETQYVSYSGARMAIHFAAELLDSLN